MFFLDYFENDGLTEISPSQLLSSVASSTISAQRVSAQFLSAIVFPSRCAVPSLIKADTEEELSCL